MKALFLAATSSLALTGFAMAQTATTTTTTEAPAAATAADAAANAAGDAAAAAGNAADAAGAAAEDAAQAADAAADKAMTTETTETAAPTTAPVDATAATTTTETAVVAPDVNAPALSAENPGMLGSWIMNRRIWTTNQPSSTAWSDTTLTERPAEWTDIAKVDDIVVDPEGNVQGYIADIGGFLGLGAKRVLLGKEALHFVKIGEDAFFATNFTKEELQALPDFDATTVMK